MIAHEPLYQSQIPVGSLIVAELTVGSHAHGTSIATADKFGTDDVDVMAIVVPPIHLSLGIDTWAHSQAWHGEHDVTAFSLQKLMGLLAKSNPNVLMLLNMPGDCVRIETPIWERLLASRDLFITKAAGSSFAGYAAAQLRKMSGSAYKGYMGEKRKAIVDEVGYDTKNAAHLIRLLRMARDLFRSGELVVRRPDADELRAIKRGERSLASVQAEADALFAEGRALLALSSLPESVDRVAVGRLSADLHRIAYEMPRNA